MEFLVNSIASTNNQSLLGVVLTEFNPDDYRSRAEVRLYDIAQFEQKCATLNPMGFVFENGALVGDTVDRRAVADSLFSYVEQEFEQANTCTLDIVDLVLLGVETNGFVVTNYQEGEQMEQLQSEGIFVPFKKFKVSNSSFNIYAPYALPDKSFRTYSLLNPEDGSGAEVVVAFPVVVDLGKFEELHPWSIGVVRFDNDQEYVVYKVQPTLATYRTSVGEAFLNYLSYNVAFYNIGEKTLKGLAPQVGEVLATPYTSDKAPRRPKVNIRIEHGYRETKLQQIVSMLSDPTQLQYYLQTNPEANITYQWIYKAYNSPWFEDTDAKAEQDRLAVSCANLLVYCRRERLKYALELLTHRYYIYAMGMVNDTLPAILHGGGVDGESIKQSDFGYR